MSRRTLPIMLFVFLVLAVLVFLQNQQAQEQTEALIEEITAFSNVFADIAVTDIAAVRLSLPAEEKVLILTRDSESTWTAPGQDGLLDINIANSIAQTIVLLPYQSSLVIDSNTDFQQYGFLPQARLMIDILMTNGEGHTILVGSLTPTLTTYYTLVDDRPELYFIARGAIDYLVENTIKPPLT